MPGNPITQRVTHRESDLNRNRVLILFVIGALSGCASRPVAAPWVPGCDLLPKLGAVTDVRMSSVDISHNGDSCRFTAVAPSRKVADEQQRMIAALATARCSVAVSESSVDDAASSSSGLSLAISRMQAEAAVCSSGAGLSAVPSDKVIDEASRRRHQPEYPWRAAREGIGGRVMLTLLGHPSGDVLGVVVAESSGHAELDEAAVKAAKQWRFHPRALDGRVFLARSAVAFQVE